MIAAVASRGGEGGDSLGVKVEFRGSQLVHQTVLNGLDMIWRRRFLPDRSFFLRAFLDAILASRRFPHDRVGHTTLEKK